MRVAALDLGSNTFLCLIIDGEIGSDGGPRILKVLSDEVRMVRLGQDVDRTRRFQPEALQRAELALADFQKTIQAFKPDRIVAMATSAARDVENSDALFELGRKYGIPIEIIPGAKEAEITFRGAISGMNVSADATLVIDIGGGSTEIISGDGPQMKWGQSLDLGCVRLKEKLGLSKNLTAEIELKARQVIREQLATLNDTAAGRIIAVAGTPTELARMEVGSFDPEKIDGFIFTREKIESWIRRLAVLTPTQIRETYQVPAGRADVLSLGLLILSETLAFFKASELTVSTRGVRYGVAFVALERGAE